MDADPDASDPPIAAPDAPDEPTDANQNVTATDPVDGSSTTVLAEVEQPFRKHRTPDEQRIAFLADVESGMPPREAATRNGVNIRTGYHILAQSDDDLDETRTAFRKLLQMQALERLDDWRTASIVGANKKGNHAPARDWLLHAGVIDVADSGTSLQVAIIIGTEDKPMKLVSPLRQSLPPQQDTE